MIDSFQIIILITLKLAVYSCTVVLPRDTTIYSGSSRGISGVSGNWSAIPEGTSNGFKGNHIMVTASYKQDLVYCVHILV